MHHLHARKVTSSSSDMQTPSSTGKEGNGNGKHQHIVIVSMLARWLGVYLGFGVPASHFENLCSTSSFLSILPFLISSHSLLITSLFPELLPPSLPCLYFLLHLHHICSFPFSPLALLFLSFPPLHLLASFIFFSIRSLSVFSSTPSPPLYPSFLSSLSLSALFLVSPPSRRLSCVRSRK